MYFELALRRDGSTVSRPSADRVRLAEPPFPGQAPILSVKSRMRGQGLRFQRSHIMLPTLSDAARASTPGETNRSAPSGFAQGFPQDRASPVRALLL